MAIIKCGNGKYKVDGGPCRFASVTAAKKFQAAMRSTRNPKKKEFLQLEILQLASLVAEERLQLRDWKPFYEVYFELDGDISKLDQWWVHRREGRLIEWLKDGPELWDEDGSPSNVHLKIIMWAHSPDPQRVLEWVATIDVNATSNSSTNKDKGKGGPDEDEEDKEVSTSTNVDKFVTKGKKRKRKKKKVLKKK